MSDTHLPPAQGWKKTGKGVAPSPFVDGDAIQSQYDPADQHAMGDSYLMQQVTEQMDGVTIDGIARGGYGGQNHQNNELNDNSSEFSESSQEQTPMMMDENVYIDDLPLPPTTAPVFPLPPPPGSI